MRSCNVNRDKRWTRGWPRKGSLNSFPISPRPNHDKFKINRRIISQSLNFIHPRWTPGKRLSASSRVKNNILIPEQTTRAEAEVEVCDWDGRKPKAKSSETKGKEIGRVRVWVPHSGNGKSSFVFSASFSVLFAIHFAENCFNVVVQSLAGLWPDRTLRQLGFRLLCDEVKSRRPWTVHWDSFVTNYERWTGHVALFWRLEYSSEIQCRRGSHAATLPGFIQRLVIRSASKVLFTRFSAETRL